ncbi:MAG TPA: TadE family protein [Chloroflexota bacterium]|nr:TadE family protein [Chloroflexota bacterium]
MRGRAQAAVEFALVLPLVLLVLAGTIEFGRAFFAYAQLLQAVQEGARYGALLGYATNDAAITARVQQLAPGGNGDPVTISATVSPTDSTPVPAANRQRGNVLQVAATHRHTVLIPLFPLSSLRLSASASMVIETNPTAWLPAPAAPREA